MMDVNDLKENVILDKSLELHSVYAKLNRDLHVKLFRKKLDMILGAQV